MDEEIYHEQINELKVKIRRLEEENEILKKTIAELEKNIKALEYSAMWQ